MPTLQKSYRHLIVLLLSCCGADPLAAAEDQSTANSPVFLGQPLREWVTQATAPEIRGDVDKIVAALTEAVLSDEPTAKRDAADALAALGPRAQPALQALLDQFNHEFPWVRVSCQAAVSSIGKDAVPALIETVRTKTGSPRVLSAYVLGGFGADAKAAVPVLQQVMQGETPVMQERLTGVLRQIDPGQFGAPSEEPVQKARYEATQVRAAAPVDARDWTQFRGPGRDAICLEEGLLREWPEGGPKLLWTLTGLGRGYSTVAVAGGKLFTMGDRPDAGGSETQYVLAYDLETRKELWATPVGVPHKDGGPRSTPTVEGDALYAIGTSGDLVCLDAGTGAVRWKKNLVSDFGGKVMSIWKFSESVLLDGDRLICTPGGPDAFLAALNKASGEVIWKCAVPDLGKQGADGAGYSSAVAAEICGVRQYVQMAGRGVFGVDAATGRFLWGYNRVANNVANITTPVVRGDYVFATTAYNSGAALLRITRQGDAFQAAEVYFVKPNDFQNHHGGVVLVGDYLYSGHGSNRGDPACIDFGSGKVLWKERAPAKGSAGVLYADGHLIFRYDRGDVLLMEASPEGMKIKGRFQTPKQEGPAWAHPVIHQGKLYLRHDTALFCYDVKGN